MGQNKKKNPEMVNLRIINTAENKEKNGNKNQNESIDAKNDIFVYEYKVKPKPNTKILTQSIMINKWVLLIIVNIVGLILLSLIGFGFIVMFNRLLPLNYGGHCTTNNECDQKYGYECSGGICTCPISHYYDRPYCFGKKNINTTCKTDAECFSSKGLGCKTINNVNMCSCSSSKIWYRGSCDEPLNYKVSCLLTSECRTSLLCLGGYCKCSTNYFWNGTYCDSSRTYMQSCRTEQNSYDNTSCIASKGLYCTKYGPSAGYCVCENLYYFDSTLQTCKNQKTGGQSCSATSECRSDLGLSCTGGVCSCANNYYWSNINKTCVQNRTIGEFCNAQFPCDGSLLLSCQFSSCRCPSGYFYFETICTKYFSYGYNCDNNAECDSSLGLSCQNSYCNCPSTQYWNFTRCVNKLTYGSSCLVNHQCVSLDCVAATKTCACPAGWFSYSGHCYAYIKDNSLGLGWSPQATWTAANANCESLGGYLAVADSQAEFDFIKNHPSINSKIWLGANYNGLSWNWLDGSTLSNWWCVNQPGTGYTSGCTLMRNGGNCLENEVCSSTENYLCEFGN